MSVICEKEIDCCMRFKGKCDALNSIPEGECSFAKPTYDALPYVMRKRGRKEPSRMPWLWQWPFYTEEDDKNEKDTDPVQEDI